MNKNVMIIEHNSNSLKPINESVPAHKDQYTLGGTFTEFDVKNRNERIYTWSKFQPAMNELNERITSLGVYGEFDHPDTFDTQLKNASHMVNAIRYDESSNSIYGEIKLLTTHWGKEARALKDEGNPLFVSSRAAGITEANGEVTLKKLFTYDIVADPGFASAKMGSLNESIGYKSDANFQIFEIGDESKINKLFEMNKDDMVTKVQLAEYSEYLVEQIATTKQKVNEVAKKGNMDPKKFEELLSYYESVQTDFSKITKYLDYLAENLQHVVSENKILKESNEKLEKTSKKLIDHNDYLAENLEKTIGYTEYLAENVDKSIQYGEYVAEQLDKSIDYSNYIAENLDKSIGFTDYLSENLNKSIEYTEYIAENVDTNIAYSEYIAEHLDDGIAYTDYIAEQLDKSIGYSKMISEKLNDTTLIKENFGDMDFPFPMPIEAGIEEVEEEEEEVYTDELVDQVDGDETLGLEDNLEDEEEAIEGDDDEEGTNCRVVCDDDEEEGIEDEELLDDEEVSLEDEVLTDSDDEENLEETPEFVEEEEVVLAENLETEEKDEDCEDCEDDTDLSKSIDKLIEEAKKRKASETNEHHFLKFLNKNQIDAFYNLGQDDQEVVAAHINEKSGYYSTNDVLGLINEALSSKEESLEGRLVRLMPDSVKDTWEKISESAKTSILTQSRLHPSSKWNEDSIEHFWMTRKFPVIKESNRELVAEEVNLIQEDKLTDDAFGKIMEKFGRI